MGNYGDLTNNELADRLARTAVWLSHPSEREMVREAARRLTGPASGSGGEPSRGAPAEPEPGDTGPYGLGDIKAAKLVAIVIAMGLLLEDPSYLEGRLLPFLPSGLMEPGK